jgi:hypothetical protein
MYHPYRVEDDSVSVQAVFSGRGINNRLILSPILTGMGNRIMETLQKQVVAEYFS